MMELDAMDTFP